MSICFGCGVVVNEEAARIVQSTLVSRTNPFSFESDAISHLASGVTATPSVKRDRLAASEKGKLKTMNFVKEWLVSQEISFYDPIPRLKLKNFSFLASKPVSIGGRHVSLKADREIYHAY